ncbi:hypothetical protein M9Y10_026076 [Tritrichomonas musculus]|uniref:Uncharacterized protein n=1 Tax=Tritrichomonas musculus TaxID=1915356 RepID=A0ABR2H9N5_9EUKA
MLSIFISLVSSIFVARHEEKSFLSWMRNTNQYYTNDEYHFRLGIFLANSRYIREFNSVKRSFKVGLNHLSCYTPSEYKALLGRTQFPTKSLQSIPKKINGDIPDSIDWREKNIVNEIRDQGQCGSCWAFGTIQACESAYALTHGILLSCSEQNLVDCCYACGGCTGGDESQALDYILNYQNGYLNSEDVYPYKAHQCDCTYDSSKGINKIKSYVHGIKDDEIYLQHLVAQGVCDIGIDASWISFHEYSSGIYDNPDCTGDSLSHAVGLVGYGAENGVEYWIVRNSWGKMWGEDGYVRMSRNKNNQCGVATEALQVYA